MCVAIGPSDEGDGVWMILIGSLERCTELNHDDWVDHSWPEVMMMIALAYSHLLSFRWIDVNVPCNFLLLCVGISALLY
jgi:hypothetical protein